MSQTLRPAADHESCGEARMVLVEALEEAGVDARDASTAVLALGEMLSNAVRHGRPRTDGCVELTWELRDEELHVAVRDAGRTDGLVADLPGPDANGGRGLWIVQQLARRWGVLNDDCTEVWAVFRAARRG